MTGERSHIDAMPEEAEPSPADRSGFLLLVAGVVFALLAAGIGLAWWIARSVVRWTGTLSGEWDLLFIAALVLGSCGLLLLTLSRSCPMAVRVLTGLGCGLLTLGILGVLWVTSLFSGIAEDRTASDWIFSPDGSRAAIATPQRELLGEPAWGVLVIELGAVSRVECTYDLVLRETGRQPRLRFTDDNTLVLGRESLQLDRPCRGED